MFSFLKKDPIANLEDKRKKLLEEAMHIQRSGDLRRYASAIEHIADVEKQIDELSKLKKRK